MLPPINGPSIGTKQAPGPGEMAQDKGKGGLANVVPNRAETGPAQLRAETQQAVDPADTSNSAKGLRKSGADATDLKEALPAGPPPAFIETLLERQARQVFEPPDTRPPADVEPDNARNDAKSGFEDARALSTPDAPRTIDVKE